MGPNQLFDARLLLGWLWLGMFLCWWPREGLILIVVSSLVCVIYTIEVSGRDRGDGPALINMDALKGLFLVHSPASLAPVEIEPPRRVLPCRCARTLVAHSYQTTSPTSGGEATSRNRASESPILFIACGVSRGIVTKSPAPTTVVSSPTVSSTWPLIRYKK